MAKPYFVPILDNGGGSCRLDYLWAFLKTFGTRTVHSCRISDSHPGRGRNRAAKAFLESDSDYLLFIDADIMFTTQDFDRLEKCDEPLVCGTYFLKQQAPVPCAHALSMGSIRMTGGLVEVARAGTGFMRIHRSVFEALKDLVPTYKNMAPAPQWDFFGSGVIDNEWLSEDWWFCDMARKAGFKVMLDTGMILRHEGTIMFPILPENPPRLRVCPETMRPHIDTIFKGEYDLGPDAKPQTILDLGGNVGGFAVWAKEQWPDATITSYEPHPDNAAIFRMNTAHLKGVTLHQKAVGGAAGNGTLFTGQDNCGQHSLKFDFSIGGVPVEIVDAATLPPADFVKLDIEGCEPEVIRAYDFSRTDYVCLEYHTEEDADVCLKLMQEKGFVVTGHDLMNHRQGVYRMARPPEPELVPNPDRQQETSCGACQ